jgi:hypothetical protein
MDPPGPITGIPLIGKKTVVKKSRDDQHSCNGLSSLFTGIAIVVSTYMTYLFFIPSIVIKQYIL